MFKHLYSTVGALAVAAASLLLTPGSTLARGGHGGGGHGGGHGGGGHFGGHGGGFHNGGGFHHVGGVHHSGGFYHGGGYRHRGGFFYGGYGLGLGYPYYGLYGWGYPGYYSSPSYYYESAPYYSENAPAYPYYSTGDYGAAYPTGGYYESSAQDQGNAQVDVNLPRPDARLTVNGKLTRQQGTHREFETSPIDQGKTYTATFVASWMENGHEVKRTKTLRLRPGQHETVNFTADKGGDVADQLHIDKVPE
jgi:uncharacterized protein (TIGR03000 family)